MGTRDRMVTSAAMLIREHGASATTIDRVLAHSGAPRGSVYHHFPGGRAELVAEAVTYAAAHGAGPLGTVGTAAPTGAGAIDPLTVLDALINTWRRRLRDSDFQAGCVIVAVAVEGPDTQPQAHAQAAKAFTLWRTRLATLLAAAGLDGIRARRLATLIVAAIEGAIVLCRTDRSLDPLDDTATELRALLISALPQEGP